MAMWNCILRSSHVRARKRKHRVVNSIMRCLEMTPMPAAAIAQCRSALLAFDEEDLQRLQALVNQQQPPAGPTQQQPTCSTAACLVPLRDQATVDDCETLVRQLCDRLRVCCDTERVLSAPWCVARDGSTQCCNPTHYFRSIHDLNTIASTSSPTGTSSSGSAAGWPTKADSNDYSVDRETTFSCDLDTGLGTMDEHSIGADSPGCRKPTHKPPDPFSSGFVLNGGGSPQQQQQQHQPWAHVAYWRQNQLVNHGRLVALRRPLLTISQKSDSTSTKSPSSDAQQSVSLDSLDSGGPGPSPPSESSRSVESRLGDGMALHRLEGDDGVCRVWLFNRSSLPLFVQTNTGAAVAGSGVDGSLSSSRRSVHRIDPQQCMCLHTVVDCPSSPVWPSPMCPAEPSGAQRLGASISVGKGFGPDFKRPNVFCCPCWFEVIFTR